MTIFDYEGEKIEGTRAPEISAFQYLSLSARPETIRVRRLIDILFHQYSLPNKANVCARLKNGNDVIFESTITELITYHSIVRLGIEVVAAEPSEYTSKGQPDFLCKTADNQHFLLEVKTIFEHSNATEAAIRRFNPLRQCINEIPNTDFFLSLRVRKFPTQNVPAKKIGEEISNWLNGLDYDTVKLSCNERTIPNRLYVFRYRDGTIDFSLTPMPRGTTRGKLVERLIGMESGGGNWSDGASKIKKAIKEKAKKYGKIDLPYYVVINSKSFLHDLEDVGEALFGTLCAYVNVKDESKAPTLGQMADGLLGSVHSPNLTRLSGIIYVRGLNAFSVAHRDFTFIPNPYAQKILKPKPSFVRQFDQLNSPFRGCFSGSLRSIFKLPAGWPEKLRNKLQ